MYFNFTSHTPTENNSSCSLVVNYLEKENLKPSIDGLYIKESFFDSTYDINNLEQKIDTNSVINGLDNNRGTLKKSAANFYMLNISPSIKERAHMERITLNELQKRNIISSNNPPASTLYFNEQFEQLMKIQMKLYVKDVMTSYAENFNREIYVDETKLPNASEKKDIEAEVVEKYKLFLKENNLEVLSKNDKKIENDKYKSYKNIKIISEKDKFKLCEITLSNGTKGEVNIPNKMLFIQPDNSYKILESVYENKIKEVEQKNILKEIDYKIIDKKQIDINGQKTTVYNFENVNEQLPTALAFSIQEKDLTVKDNKYFISEHLYNEKNTAALQKSIDKDTAILKEKLYNKIAHEKGFNLTKRPLTEKDLLWYAKIEKSRTYKTNDPAVKHNMNIDKQINKLKTANKPDISKITKLQKEYMLDPVTKVKIEKDQEKGGLQYHAHILISRHDKTMQNTRNKLSLSPLANATNNKMHHGAQVGFDRKQFAEKIEKNFDEKFDYDRKQKESFKHYNSIANQINSKVKSKVKQYVMKETGLATIKNEINPIQKIKHELGIANIPTQIPKGIVDLAVKIVRRTITNTLEI